VISFGLASNLANIEKYDVFGFIKTLLKYSLPSLLTLIVLIWLITVNVIYFKRINQGKVAGEYYTYSTMTTIIVIAQIIFLFKYLTDSLKSIMDIIKQNQSANSDLTVPTNKMAYVTYFLTFLNFIFIGIMTIILQFFSTDG
jgi:hypothetical protein